MISLNFLGFGQTKWNKLISEYPDMSFPQTFQIKERYDKKYPLMNVADYQTYFLTQTTPQVRVIAKIALEGGSTALFYVKIDGSRHSFSVSVFDKKGKISRFDGVLIDQYDADSYSDQQRSERYFVADKESEGYVFTIYDKNKEGQDKVYQEIRMGRDGKAN
ncbi:hypothetical protein [Hugenholtzia roseola]|uniref:hypothetical protein n=1 Tax=Hugenholtzia roseola TaxID=1002 RepID=UPI0004794FFC|nr:hypothetical protein [Hugenholtzia roseola]